MCLGAIRNEHSFAWSPLCEWVNHWYYVAVHILGCHSKWVKFGMITLSSQKSLSRLAWLTCRGRRSLAWLTCRRRVFQRLAILLNCFHPISSSSPFSGHIQHKSLVEWFAGLHVPLSRPPCSTILRNRQEYSALPYSPFLMWYCLLVLVIVKGYPGLRLAWSCWCCVIALTIVARNCCPSGCATKRNVHPISETLVLLQLHPWS